MGDSEGVTGVDVDDDTPELDEIIEELLDPL